MSVKTDQKAIFCLISDNSILDLKVITGKGEHCRLIQHLSGKNRVTSSEPELDSSSCTSDQEVTMILLHCIFYHLLNTLKVKKNYKCGYLIA